MLPHSISIGDILFDNITVYSKSDKIRDKGTFQTNVNGLEIRVSNHDGNPGWNFSCEGMGMRNKRFIDKTIDLDIACRFTLKNIKTKLEQTIKLL